MASSTPNHRSSRSRAQGKPFQPAVGREFDVREADAKTRGFLARLIALTTVTAVVAAGGYGLITGNFSAVNAVWIVAGPIIGAVVTHYFGRPERKDTG
jgi:hypothetical protein